MSQAIGWLLAENFNKVIKWLIVGLLGIVAIAFFFAFFGAWFIPLLVFIVVVVVGLVMVTPGAP